MIDVRLNIPPFEADFESVVDSIRETGVITNTSLAGTSTTLDTVNDLKVNQTLLINGISCKITSASPTQIVVNKDVDGATSWKAEAPYFMDGHIEEINIRLKRKDESADSVLKWQKYPLVVLLQDIDYDKNIINPSETSIDFIVVNDTKQEYTTSQRRANNFIPILDPLYNKLIGALKNAPGFRITNDNFSVSRKYLWGAVPQGKNIFNDRLDAIKVDDLNLELITPNCI